jgi:hypothetical protein
VSCADFAGRVGEAFDVAAGDAVLQVELVEATESTEPGGRGPEGQTRMQFSLLFRGPASPLLPQATYLLSHAGLGEIDLFLVSVGSGDYGVHYEAAFA